MRTWVLVVSGVVALCAPVLGHHSYSELYIEADTIEVEGEVIEFQYRNPHSWIHVMGQEAFGEAEALRRRVGQRVASRARRHHRAHAESGRHRPHLGEPEPQPERQSHPPQTHRAPSRSLEVGRSGRSEPEATIAVTLAARTAEPESLVSVYKTPDYELITKCHRSARVRWWPCRFFRRRAPGT